MKPNGDTALDVDRKRTKAFDMARKWIEKEQPYVQGVPIVNTRPCNPTEKGLMIQAYAEALLTCWASGAQDTSALPVRLIMDKVASWQAMWDVDPPDETPEGLRGMWDDLRQRLETIKP